MINAKVLRAASVLLGSAALLVLVTVPPFHGSAGAAPASPEDLAACQDENAPRQPRRDVCTRVIEDASQIAEIRAEAYLNRGLVFEAQGDDRGAIADYSEAIKLNPDYGVLYHYRGLAYEREDQSALAIADYTKALTLDPSDLEALSYRAHAYGDSGDYQRAIVDFDALIARQPNDADAYAGRGEAHEGLNQKAKALADFRKAIALEPDNEEAKAGLKRLAGNL